MKPIHVLTVFNLLFYLWLFTTILSYPQSLSSTDLTSRKIDSLVEIQKLNEQCILIKFGPDAITAINTKKGIVVIDAGISTGLTAIYKKIIQNHFQNDDFAYVINSHAHPDHIGGNSIFPNAAVVSHVNSHREISSQWNNSEKITNRLSKIVEKYDLQLQAPDLNTKEWNDIIIQKTRYLFAYYDAVNLVPIKYPDLTFSDSLTLNLDNVTIEMIYFGKCHSDSDILIYVPRMKILFIGDLFSKYGKPAISDPLMTDKDIWSRAVRWIKKRIFNITKIIGGHGQFLSVDDLKNFSTSILSSHF